MKTLTVRLPEALVAGIESEARTRNVAKSDIVRERLSGALGSAHRTDVLQSITDLIGSVEGLPPDVSARKKRYLEKTGYGRARGR